MLAHMTPLSAPPPITSRRHAVVARCRALAQGRGPEEDLLLDGAHLVAEALDSGLGLDVLLVDDSRADTPVVARLTAAVPADRIVRVAPAVFPAVSPVRTPSGLVAIARRPRHSPADVLGGAGPLVVIGVDVQDPGNTGALLRAAEAGGATGALFAGASADPWSWKALRGAMGSAFRVPLARMADARDAMAAARAAGLMLVAAVPAGGMSIYEADLTPPLALLLGGEGPGLPDDVVGAADVQVSIPMAGAVESLNVAVAGALLLYEARRQREPGRR